MYDGNDEHVKGTYDWHDEHAFLRLQQALDAVQVLDEAVGVGYEVARRDADLDASLVLVLRHRRVALLLRLGLQASVTTTSISDRQLASQAASLRLPTHTNDSLSSSTTHT